MTADDSRDRHRRLRDVLGGVWQELCADAAAPMPLLTAELALTTQAGAIRLARDADGLPHLLVPLPGHPPAATVYRSSGLRLTVRPLLVEDRPSMFADLACLRGDVREVFLSMVADACQRVAASPTSPGDALNRSVEEWRALFAGTGGAWTRARLAGLFAELTVLRRLLLRHPHAAGTWTGPNGAAQDFRGATQSLEVKATLGGEGRMIRIHGSDQLDAPAGTHLHLAWFRLTDAPPDGGRTVRQLLEDVLALATDLAVLVDRVERLGFPEPGTSEVDDRRFAVVEERWLRVDAAFPRIVPASFTDGAVPGGVTAVEYLVDLDVVPVSEVDPSTILDRLATQP
jgi:hypothetical protein